MLGTVGGAILYVEDRYAKVVDLHDRIHEIHEQIKNSEEKISRQSTEVIVLQQQVFSLTTLQKSNIRDEILNPKNPPQPFNTKRSTFINN